MIEKTKMLLPHGSAPLGRALLLAVAAGMAFAGSAAAQETPPGLTAYRFWRAPDQTLVEGVATVPWSLLSFESQQGNEQAIYAATFQVKSAAGEVLLKNEWQDTVLTQVLTPESRSRASSTSTFAFRVPGGRYTLDLTVRDVKSGRSATATTTVEALQQAPATSDLILAAGIEQAPEAGSPPAGTLVRGELAVLPNPSGAIASGHTRIGVLAEVYRPRTEQPETASVVVRIDGTGGSTFRYQTPPQTRLFQGGGVDALAVDLTGLPPGEYRLSTLWTIGGDTLRAQHPLRMLPPGAGTIAYAGEASYAGLSVAQLDSIYEPMRYIMPAEQEVAYEMLDTAEGKARWLSQFWEQAAREAGKSPQQMRDDWQKRVDYVNLAFNRPGRTGTQGWQTDRGRIFLTYGAPTEKLEERQRQDQQNPWEAWKYTTGRGDKYVFWDQSGFGDYILVFSTNRNENSLPGWTNYFTRLAVQQITNW